MKNRDLFLQNLKLLKKKDPSLAALLSLTSYAPSQIKKTQALELNYQIKLGANAFDLHDSFSAQEEANRQVYPLTSKPIKRLIFFGVGAGYLLNALKAWFQEDHKRQLVIFEDQIEVLKILFSTSLGTFLLNQHQVKIFYFKTPHFWETKQTLIQRYLSQPFEITALPSYLKNRQEDFKTLYNRLIALSIDQNITFAEYIHVSPLVYENILNNALKLPKAFDLYGLQDKFKGLPAIICGAGPSLNKNGPQLNELKDRALIFAGGRALSVLNDLGVEPHLSIGIDPYKEHKTTLRCNNFFELPLIYRSRMQHEATELAQGFLLYTPGAIGYSFVKWLETELGIPSPFLEEGLNVVNFNLQVARILGCNPIILVGSDLAYTDQKAYSESIPDEQCLPDPNEFQSDDLTLNRGYLREDLHGNPIFTLWKWTEEAKWIEQFSQKHPSLKIVNATEGGLKLQGLEHITLKKAKEKYLSASFDFSAFLHQSIMQATSYKLEKKHILLKVEYFYKSIEKTLDLLDALKASSSPLLRSDLVNEVAYSHLLLPLENLFERVEEESSKSARDTKKYQFLKEKLSSYAAIFNHFLTS